MLVTKEIAILRSSRDNDYNNALEEGGTWVFAVIDHSELDPKVAGGVISSLVKKGIVQIIEDNGYPGTPTLEYTEKGKVLALKALNNS